MVLIGVEFMLSLVEEDHFSAKMVFNDKGAIFFRVNQQHCYQKAEGISYKDNYEGNALAAMLAARKVEIRYHQQFSDNRVASIMASLMEQPRLSFMKGWKVTYQGRVLSVPKVYPPHLIFPKNPKIYQLLENKKVNYIK
jgi:hypothetical protein